MGGPVDQKVRVELREGVVWVELRGLIAFDDSMRAMKMAAEAARTYATDRLVFDIRGTRHPEFHVAALESARIAPDLGLSTALRCAVLGNPDDERLGFIEDVAANRGFKTRAFTDEAQALAWVKGSRA
jgi:hypothetical protein